MSSANQNAIRPYALDRKSWVFIRDVGAGQRPATLSSLLGSYLRGGINPRAYLHWLFAKLPAVTNRTVRTMTATAYATLTDGKDKAEAQKAA